MIYQTRQTARAAAKAKACKTDAPAYVLRAGYDFEVFSTKAVEQLFAEGDLTEYEFRRDLFATVHP